MALSGINPKSNFYDSFFTNKASSDLKMQAQKAKEELIKAQKEIKSNQNQSILSSTFKTSNYSNLNINVPIESSEPVKIPESLKKPQKPEENPKPTSNISQWNTVVNTQSTTVNVKNGENNKVFGSSGWSSSGNKVDINGANNKIDIRGKNVYELSDTTYNATGGASVKNNSVNVTGNNNSVDYTGNRLSDNKTGIEGSGNNVTLGSAISGTNLNIKANNVNVKVENNDLLKKGNDGWKINVNASDINITIKDGKAELSGTGLTAEGVKVTVNNETKSVDIIRDSAIA